MRITVSLPERPDAWIAGLQRELPDAVVEAWTPGAAPADHAVVWAPSQRFIDEQRPTLRIELAARGDVVAWILR